MCFSSLALYHKIPCERSSSNLVEVPFFLCFYFFANRNQRNLFRFVLNKVLQSSLVWTLSCVGRLSMNDWRREVLVEAKEESQSPVGRKKMQDWAVKADPWLFYYTEVLSSAAGFTGLQMFEIGRDLWRSSGLAPLFKQGHLESSAQVYVWMSSVYLQKCVSWWSEGSACVLVYTHSLWWSYHWVPLSKAWIHCSYTFPSDYIYFIYIYICVCFPPKPFLSAFPHNKGVPVP